MNLSIENQRYLHGVALKMTCRELLRNTPSYSWADAFRTLQFYIKDFQGLDKQEIARLSEYIYESRNLVHLRNDKIFYYIAAECSDAFIQAETNVSPKMLSKLRVNVAEPKLTPIDDLLTRSPNTLSDIMDYVSDHHPSNNNMRQFSGLEQ